ncbi:MerR family transcriptional regulator [bacterium]|nr:MerR family transcriptional regulator [bacterium]
MLDENSPILTVSKVAKMLNISADRLRTYDEENLVEPTRTGNNARMYSCNDVNWLEALRKLINKPNISILGIKEILRIIYFMDDDQFEIFTQKQPKDSIWQTFAQMKKNPNFEKLRKYYT